MTTLRQSIIEDQPINPNKRTYSQRINGNYIRQITTQDIYRPVKRIKYEPIKPTDIIVRPKLKMTTKKGEQLETQVAQKLRSIDIEVIHSRIGKDHGVDILANYQGIQIIVQCKNQETPVTSEQIAKFESCVQRRVQQPEKPKIVIGLFVTKNGYTNPALKKARSSRYLILTTTIENYIKELQNAIRAVQIEQQQRERKTEINNIKPRTKRPKGVHIVNAPGGTVYSTTNNINFTTK
jgi:Holliday junction resolvase